MQGTHRAIWRLSHLGLASLVVAAAAAGFSSHPVAAHIIRHQVAAGPTATPTRPSTTVTYIPPMPRTSRSGVAAEVDGVQVPMELFVEESVATAISLQHASQNQQTGATIPALDLHQPAALKHYRQQQASILKNLIDTAIVVAYANKNHLGATSKEVAAQLSGYQSRAGGAARFAQQIQAQGFTLPVVREIIANQFTIQHVYTALTAHAPCPCDVHVRHILLKATQKSLAFKLDSELKANKGTTFAVLAKRYSIDVTSGRQGGDLGFISRGQTVAPFDKAAFSLKIGQISDPVLSQFGWHIIQVLGTRPTSVSRGKVFSTWLQTARVKATVHTYVVVPAA